MSRAKASRHVRRVSQRKPDQAGTTGTVRRESRVAPQAQSAGPGVHSVLSLQETLGNQQVARLLAGELDVAPGLAGVLALTRQTSHAAGPVQRPLGNKATAPEFVSPKGTTTMVVGQRIGTKATASHRARRQPAAPAANNIARLDELLDRWFTPEGEVITLLGAMNATEKRTVIAGYRDRLVRTFNFAEMRRAVIALGAELPVKLDWIDQVSPLTSLINYSEIQSLITSAPQPERDMLNNARWKSFFMSVCDNRTIIAAVTDLNFDLPTKLRWIGEEASALLTLRFSMLEPLLRGASPADRAAVAGDDWLPFWTDVCTDATMADLVDILFPDNPLKRLEWMAVEASVSLSNAAEIIDFVLSLRGGWTKWREYARAAGLPLGDLAKAALTKGLITEAVVVGLVRIIETRGPATAARDYIRNLNDLQLATLVADPVAADVIPDVWHTDSAPVMAALNGELAAGEQAVHLSETLLSGPTTSPFVARVFGSDQRFTIRYTRTAVHVDVGVELEPKDARATTLLSSAIAIWRANIEGAWDNQFKITNGQRTIPLRFHANLGSGPNHVNVHSGVWAWPKLNAGNWFVPDPVKVPSQAAAVSTAPVHEFGHLIGNLDEYMLGAAHYLSVTGQVAATDPDAVPETDTAGTTRYANSLSVMGSGTTILQRHVQNILTWVNGNLRTGEPSFSFAP